MFEYLDYRALLRDYYERSKTHHRGFSYRMFARRVGAASPNHLKRVADGDRNLSAEMAAKYAVAMGLNEEASAYFQNLVAFNQARTSLERTTAYQMLRSFSRYRKVHKLDLAQASYHSNWYLPAIREMAARKDFRAEPAWIAKRLRPQISVSEAASALDTLFQLGLLVREADGRISQGEAIVSTGPETTSMHLANYHRTMLERAIASIDEVKAAERDISSLTFAVGPGGLQRLKERLQRFRKEIIAIATEEKDHEQVVQLNLQVFPLTTKSSEEES